MPSLYGFTSNANVAVGNTTGLYQQPGGNVQIFNNAQFLLNTLSQNGNVNFALDPATSNTKVLAYTANIGAAPGTYGNLTSYPVITVTSDGRVTGITTVPIDTAGFYSNANVAAYLPTYSGNLGGTLTTASPAISGMQPHSFLSLKHSI